MKRPCNGVGVFQNRQYLEPEPGIFSSIWDPPLVDRIDSNHFLKNVQLFLSNHMYAVLFHAPFTLLPIDLFGQD